MAISPLKKVADAPLNAQNQRVITGANWDYNFNAIEAKFNKGITVQDISDTAGITGTQMSDSTISRAKATADFELQSLLMWINL